MPLAIRLISISLLIQISFGCLATQNPEPDTTTTIVTTTTTTTACNCRFPVNNAGATCNSQPPSLATFMNNGMCQLTWTGCTNYRYVFNNVCTMGPQAQNPATVQGPFTCPGQNQFPVNAMGVTFDAVDCGP